MVRLADDRSVACARLVSVWGRSLRDRIIDEFPERWRVAKGRIARLHAHPAPERQGQHQGGAGTPSPSASPIRPTPHRAPPARLPRLDWCGDPVGADYARPLMCEPFDGRLGSFEEGGRYPSAPGPPPASLGRPLLLGWTKRKPLCANRLTAPRGGGEGGDPHGSTSWRPFSALAPDWPHWRSPWRSSSGPTPGPHADPLSVHDPMQALGRSASWMSTRLIFGDRWWPQGERLLSKGRSGKADAQLSDRGDIPFATNRNSGGVRPPARSRTRRRGAHRPRSRSARAHGSSYCSPH